MLFCGFVKPNNRYRKRRFKGRKKGQNGVGCGCQNGTKDESRWRILLTLLFITIYRKVTKEERHTQSIANFFPSMPLKEIGLRRASLSGTQTYLKCTKIPFLLS